MFIDQKFLPIDNARSFLNVNLDLYLEITSKVRPKVEKGIFWFICEICSELTNTEPSNDWNMRNSIVCKGCGFGGRQRHMYGTIKKVMKSVELKHRMIYEQVTEFKRRIDLDFGEFAGSEFLDPDFVSGQYYPYSGTEIIHQDMLSTSYDSNTFDLIVSLDVLEHVRSIPLALAESYRIMKHGGIYLLTVPFYDQRSTEIRADIIDNNVVHYLPPAYHGNPVSGDGALVFTDPGVELLDMMRDAGFEIRVSLGADVENGYLPDGNMSPTWNCWNLVFMLIKN